MGKTKPFIDKKNAKTYSLLYGDIEVDPVAPEAGRPNTTGEVHAGKPSDFLHFAPEEISWDLPDSKRKDIVELGLPDDGYDYLQHLKDPAAAGAPADVKVAAEGPRVFLPAPYLEPPPEDIKYVDARSLPQLTVTEDEDILEVLGGVAPFARDLDEEPTDRANEVDALNEIMRELENADVDGEHSDAGDLLDDFVSTAAARASTGGMHADKRSGHAEDDTVSEEDSGLAMSESSEEEDFDGRESRLGRAYVGSIASTYWRPERKDRGGLSALDERFEQLALEYDSDELGDLEDVEGGGAGLESFGSVLEKSMAQQITRVPLVEALQRAPGHAAGSSEHDDDDARIAIQKARELLDASLLDEGNEVVVAEARSDRDVDAKGNRGLTVWETQSAKNERGDSRGKETSEGAGKVGKEGSQGDKEGDKTPSQDQQMQGRLKFSNTGHRIVSLDPEVVQQIAAGEVIQRPANAVKELLDNALDAGSTQITISVKEGGKKLLTVQDNGHGIERDDLPLLCKRHATSKLRSFEDLNSLSTLGFRGEALASISTAAHLTVITKTAAAVAGLKTRYRNTILEPPGPLPCAAQNGTTFIVDDLFYNNEQRRKALGSGAEEYARILDLVGRYAISRPDVGFSCKKQGERRPELHTVAGTSTQDNIRAVHGASIAKSMLPLELSKSGEEVAGTPSTENTLTFSVSGFVSCTHYSGRKGIFLIRINGHLVQCRALEHSLEAAYFSHARNKPFVYLDLKLPGDQVDVNVHPTKHEVVFLHQDEILACINEAVEGLLQGPIRCHCMQSIAHNGPIASTGVADPRRATDKGVVRVTDMVRTDVQSQKLQIFFETAAHGGTGTADAAAVAINSVARKPLVRDINIGKDEGLKHRLQNSVYVGMADTSRALVQHDTDLLLVDLGSLGCDLFYQLVLKNWGTLQRLQIDEPVRIADLAVLALQVFQPDLLEDERWQGAISIEQRLTTYSKFLAQGAAVDIDPSNGSLKSLPKILDGCMPDQNRLPLLVYRLAECSDWDDGKEAIRSTAQALAEFYSTQAVAGMMDLPRLECIPSTLVLGSSAGDLVDPVTYRDCTDLQTRQIEHVLFPAVRSKLIPSARRAKDGSIVHLVSLKTLYKVFERC
ncbi:g36 [Coccomyxa elongata]